jgi:hypothetical protein
MKRTLIAFVLVAIASNCYAGAATLDMFSFKAQVWHRFEASKRQFNADLAYNNFNLMRSRLSVGITPNEDIEAFIQLQDSRVWGEEFNTLLDGSADNFDLHQGYVKIKDFFDAPLDVKLGRQSVNYGDQRLIGAVEWHRIGRSFDGAIADLHGEKWWVDGFAFQVVDSLYPGDYQDLFLWGAYANYMPRQNHQAQLFAVWQRKQPSSVLNRGTIGWFLKGNFGAFSYKSDAGYQFGTITPARSQDNPVSDIEAWMFTLELGWVPADVKWKPGLFLAADVLSGDEDASVASGANLGADGKWKVFDTLYGTNHKFYGFMDYFINIPVNTFGGGLVDTWGRFKLTPLNRTPMMLDVHYFQAQQDVLLSDGESKSNKFGTEVDFTLRHNYAESLTFVLGASWFGPDGVFKDRRGVDDSTWFYVWTIFNV